MLIGFSNEIALRNVILEFCGCLKMDRDVDKIEREILNYKINVFCYCRLDPSKKWSRWGTVA